MTEEKRLELIATIDAKIKERSDKVLHLRTMIARGYGDRIPSTVVYVDECTSIQIEGASAGTRELWREMLHLESNTVENEIDMLNKAKDAVLQDIPADTPVYVKAVIDYICITQGCKGD